MPLISIVIGRYQVFKKMKKVDLKIHGNLPRISILSSLRKKENLVPLLSILATTLMINGDVIIVKMFFEPELAGIYSLFSLFAKIILYATAPITAVAYTFFTGSESNKKSGSVLMLATGAFLFFGIGMLIIYAFFPELLIRVVSTEEYLKLSTNLFYAAIFGTVYSISMLFSQYLVSKNSWWVILGAIASIIQMALIFFNHYDYLEVMQVNVAVVSTLVIIYGIILMTRYLKKKYAYHH
jgi:O-antigen/teichoic acid export membrane protein